MKAIWNGEVIAETDDTVIDSSALTDSSVGRILLEEEKPVRTCLLTTSRYMRLSRADWVSEGVW